MGVERYRRKHVLSGMMTVAGSAGFDGVVSVSSTFQVAGAVVHSSTMTRHGQTTTRAASLSAQFAGRTRVGCGSVSVTVSTTAVKTNALIQILGLDMLGAAVAAAAASLGPFVVLSVGQSTMFQMGWLTGNNAIPNIPFDVMWKIDLQG